MSTDGRAVRWAAAALQPLTLLWPRGLRRAAAAEREAVLLDVLRDAYATRGWSGLAARWLYEAVDAVAVGMRFRPPAQRAAVGLAGGALVAVLLVASLIRAGAGGELVVIATDPAGDFTLTFRGDVLVAATVDHVPYGGDRLVQTGDSVRVLDAAGRTLVSVEYLPPGRIRWEPREPGSL